MAPHIKCKSGCTILVRGWAGRWDQGDVSRAVRGPFNWELFSNIWTEWFPKYVGRALRKVHINFLQKKKRNWGCIVRDANYWAPRSNIDEQYICSQTKKEGGNSPRSCKCTAMKSNTLNYVTEISSWIRMELSFCNLLNSFRFALLDVCNYFTWIGNRPTLVSGYWKFLRTPTYCWDPPLISETMKIVLTQYLSALPQRELEYWDEEREKGSELLKKVWTAWRPFRKMVHGCWIWKERTKS